MGTISFSIEDEMLRRVDARAEAENRPRSALLREAIERFLGPVEKRRGRPPKAIAAPVKRGRPPKTPPAPVKRGPERPRRSGVEA